MKKRVALWFARIFGIMLGLCAIFGAIISTQSSKPYDERTYILMLALFAMLLFHHFSKEADEIEKNIKEDKEKEEAK